MKRPVKSNYSLIIVVLVFFSFAATTILRSAETREQGLEVIRLWKTTPPAPNMELTGEIDTTKPDSDLVADRRVIRLGNVSNPTLMRVGLETLPNRMTLRSATKSLSGFVVSISPVSSMFGAGGVVFQSRMTSRPCSRVSAERRIVVAANEKKTRTTIIRE